jgi:hypothetical protein
MASGHVNRTKRPNTWLHRPDLRREDSPCQLGAVHTWPIPRNDASENVMGEGSIAAISGHRADISAYGCKAAPCRVAG